MGGPGLHARTHTHCVYTHRVKQDIYFINEKKKTLGGMNILLSEELSQNRKGVERCDSIMEHLPSILKDLGQSLAGRRKEGRVGVGRLERRKGKGNGRVEIRVFENHDSLFAIKMFM